VLERPQCGAETTVSGSEFQICEAATGKAWSPSLDSFKNGSFTDISLTNQLADNRFTGHSDGGTDIICEE